MRRIVMAICILAAACLAPAQDKKPETPITRAMLDQRLGQLKAAREQALANLNAYDGAIQECNYWISQIEAAEKAAAVTAAAQKPVAEKPKQLQANPDAAKVKSVKDKR
jgi:hypothetical protein